VLVIEVAASSLPVDLAVKAPLYASAGIAEYWVLDVDGRRVVVHRDPTPEGYRQRLALTADEPLSSVALPLPALRVTDALDAG
jgi:Uma2 family endonuclease